MKPIITAVRLEKTDIECTSENMEALIFWGMYEGRQVRLFYFDEDTPAPNGFVEADYTMGEIPGVAFWMQESDL